MDTPKLFEAAIKELETMLSTKSVVGEPIKLDGTTVVPLVSLGFGFGVGTSETGGGIGGGGGVKPVAVVVMDENGVRLESVRMASSTIGKVADTVGELARSTLEKRGGKRLAKDSSGET